MSMLLSAFLLLSLLLGDTSLLQGDPILKLMRMGQSVDRPLAAASTPSLSPAARASGLFRSRGASIR